MTSFRPKRDVVLLLGAGLAVLALIVDQLSKHAVLAHFAEGGPSVEPVTSWLNIVLVANHGVSFGLFNDHGAGRFNWQLYAFSGVGIVVVIGLLVALWRTASWWSAAGFGLIIGGAIGNLIDRVRVGSVVDFIDCFIGDWHWYIFNIADAAICIGVGLLLLDSLLLGAESPRASANRND